MHTTLCVGCETGIDPGTSKVDTEEGPLHLGCNEVLFGLFVQKTDKRRLMDVPIWDSEVAEAVLATTPERVVQSVIAGLPLIERIHAMTWWDLVNVAPE